MKNKLTLLAAAICLLFSANAQPAGPNPMAGTFTFFSEEGEKFTLHLNGEQANTSPQSKVVVEDVVDMSLSVRIVMEDASVPPIKKSMMRMGKDCIYVIKKNKKGEYVVSFKSSSGTLPGMANAAAGAVAGNGGAGNAGAAGGSAPAASAGGDQKMTAEYSDGTIYVNGAIAYYVTKSKTTGGFPSPHVIMKNPVGAKVTITFDGGGGSYEAEVPFDYETDSYTNNNAFFKLTVDEGGPNKTWSVKLQNGTGYNLTIE